jgi:nondiscriminating aspartyl-tRNA synthetase
MSDTAEKSNNPTAAPPAQEGEKKPSKKELKKLEKKGKKEQMKAARAAQQTQNKPAVEESSANCGDLPMIRSAELIKRSFTNVADLDESKDQAQVLIRSRLHTSRGKGNLCFIVLRQQSHTVQAVLEKGEHVNKYMLKFAAAIPKESIVEVEGIVRKATVKECTQKTVELAVLKLFVVSRSVPNLPLQIEDAARPQHVLDEQEQKVEAIDAQIKQFLESATNPNDPAVQAEVEQLQKKKAAAQEYVIVSQDTRLDNRVLDLRTPASHAIFRVQSGVCQLFREFLLSEGFVEIHTPKMISAASEGGAQVFRLQYFETAAFLAQSPQLYKQMAITSDFERVFEIGPVFRAENSNTHRHMTEFVGLDLEMAFKDHYYEVLDVLDRLFVSIFEGLEKRFAKEIEIISQQYTFQPFKYLKPSLRLQFPQAVQLLREAGLEHGDLDDLSTAEEKVLGKIIREKYNTDFYILDKFPAVVRPFYTMIDPKDEKYSNSYDFFVRGEEIVSGAQRIHDPVMLEQRAKACNIDISSIQAYIDAFKYGAPPHGGCGIGLERLVMLYLGLNNIRKTSMFPRDPKRLTP